MEEVKLAAYHPAVLADLAAKREYQRSLRRAKKLAAEQPIELTLEETILIVQAIRLGERMLFAERRYPEHTHFRDEYIALLNHWPLDLHFRLKKISKEQIDELRSYARMS